MKIEIIENSYKNGQRICLQKNYYNKSEDLYELANLHKRLERYQIKLSEQLPEEEKEELTSRIKLLEEQIINLEQLIANYDK